MSQSNTSGISCGKVPFQNPIGESRKQHWTKTIINMQYLYPTGFTKYQRYKLWERKYAPGSAEWGYYQNRCKTCQKFLMKGPNYNLLWKTSRTYSWNVALNLFWPFFDKTVRIVVLCVGAGSPGYHPSTSKRQPEVAGCYLLSRGWWERQYSSGARVEVGSSVGE